MPAATEGFTSAGAKLSISSAKPASITKTAYAALTWTQIKNVTDHGGSGRQYNMVSYTPVDTRGVIELKGSFTDGTKTVEAAYAPGDPGQVILATALDDDDHYAFKEELQDGTVIYFLAQVTSKPTNVGGADALVSTTINLSLKSGSRIEALPA